MRFPVILETGTHAKVTDTLFQIPDGTAFVFAAASNRAQADRLSAALGRDSSVFEVRPQWSLPYDACGVRNPELWKR